MPATCKKSRQSQLGQPIFIVQLAAFKTTLPKFRKKKTKKTTRRLVRALPTRA